MKRILKRSQKIALGTAQLGFDYGVNNERGQPPIEHAFEILHTAYDGGVRTLDTAQGYGAAHQVIGSFHRAFPAKKFKIISKFATTNDCSDSALIESVFKMVKELEVEALYGLLFHSFHDYENMSEKVIQLKSELPIQKLGVSVYENNELDIVLTESAIDLVQFPFNLIDNENVRGEKMRALKLQNKEIHVRSIFLQGLFFKDPKELSGNLCQLMPVLTYLNTIANEHKITIAEMALNYVLNNPLVDKLIIGVDRADQLKSNLASIDKPLNIPDIASRISAFPYDTSVLNPNNWNFHD